MMKTFVSFVVTALVLQACAGSSSPGGGQAGHPPAQVPNVPGAKPESGSFFSGIDQSLDAKIKGDRLLTERFTVLLSRLSVYALICDFKNQFGYSSSVSKLYNGSTRLLTLSNQVYGSEKASYNRFEKQRNIESRRLSFESPPNTCTLSQAAFVDEASLSPAELEAQIRNTPRGAF